MVSSTTTAAELNLERVECKVCSGIARFCKLSVCPYYKNLLREVDLKRLECSSSIYGPSPPSILVGEWGYPLVKVGPAITLLDSIDAGFLESPSRWLEYPIEELLALRLSLFYGRSRVKVYEGGRSRGILESIQESAIAAKPVDLEVSLRGSLNVMPGFSVRAAPYGPSARIEGVKLAGNVSVPRKVEQIIEEKDVPVRSAVEELHGAGMDEYYLSRVLSAGLLGRSRERRVVPTEWSITAIDDMLSRGMIQKIREFNIISEFRLHNYEALHNAAYVLLMSTPWMFELLEGWLKHVASSPYTDYEYLGPRRSYAENTGGAYYAVRLAVLRHLMRHRVQAGAIVFFEVMPGWIPLGVWRFREITREALERPPERFNRLEEALEAISHRLRLPIERYRSRSHLIPLLMHQKRIE